MDENIGSAGAALAAHSKDGSATGQTAAPKATAKPGPASLFDASEQAINDTISDVSDFVRQQPFIAAALIGSIGVVIGLLLGRR